MGLRDNLACIVDVAMDSDMKQAKDPCGFAFEVARPAVQTMGRS